MASSYYISTRLVAIVTKIDTYKQPPHTLAAVLLCPPITISPNHTESNTGHIITVSIYLLFSLQNWKTFKLFHLCICHCAIPTPLRSRPHSCQHAVTWIKFGKTAKFCQYIYCESVPYQNATFCNPSIGAFQVKLTVLVLTRTLD